MNTIRLKERSLLTPRDDGLTGIAHSGTLRPQKKVLVGFKPQWYSPFWDPKTSIEGPCGFQNLLLVALCQWAWLAGVNSLSIRVYVIVFQKKEKKKKKKKLFFGNFLLLKKWDLIWGKV
jgi:hypothetical protein